MRQADYLLALFEGAQATRLRGAGSLDFVDLPDCQGQPPAGEGVVGELRGSDGQGACVRGGE
jgi:hypothetical protein